MAICEDLKQQIRVVQLRQEAINLKHSLFHFEQDHQTRRREEADSVAMPASGGRK